MLQSELALETSDVPDVHAPMAVCTSLNEGPLEYLDGQYAAAATELGELFCVPPPYGSAYREVLHVRLIRRIFDHLHISTVRNKSSTEVQTAAGLVQSVTVTDIVQWARMGSLKNYRHARKRVANLYTLRHDLQRANSLAEAEMDMLAALSALCGSERLPTIQDLASLEPEAGIVEAVTARARTLEGQVRAMVKSRGLEGHLIANFELML